MKHIAEQFELPFVDPTITDLNKRYPIGAEVTQWNGVSYKIQSEWSKEQEWYGAWARSEKNNHTIWITNGELQDEWSHWLDSEISK